jgi:hypothetical protein
MSIRAAREGDKTHLDDLPPSCNLVRQLLANARYHCGIYALFHPVFSADDDLTRGCIAEEENLLCRECHNKDRDRGVENFSIGDLEIFSILCLHDIGGREIILIEILTSTDRISSTLLSLTRPWRRYCSMVAQRTL